MDKSDRLVMQSLLFAVESGEARTIAAFRLPFITRPVLSDGEAENIT